MRLLIINADDFGYGSGITLGILDAHKKGVLTSTTIMAGMPGFERAVRLAIQTPSLGIGVHLTLTCGKPLLQDVPSLTTSNGEFKRLSFYEDHFEINQNELYREWKAQIDRVIASGITPDHLDSHHHVHTLNGVTEVFEQLATDYELPVRGNYNVSPGIVTIKRFNDALDQIGVFKPIWQPMPLHNLIEDVKTFGSVEAMCHPGYVDADLTEHSSFTTGRTYTLRELIKPELKARLAAEGVKLGTYRDLVTQDQPLEEEPV